MIDFTGKTVLLSGGGAGIGRAAVESFARLGATIGVIEIDADRAENVRQWLGDQGPDHFVVTGDVCDKPTVEALAATTEAKFGKLDVLVNNVGDYCGIAKPLEIMTDEDIARLYAMNLGHLFNMSRAMIPLLRRAAPGSSIVNVSSIEGFRGHPRMVAYGTFKAAVTGFTQSLGLELAPEGIRVNVVAPETSDTAQLPIDRMVPEENRHLIKQWIPLGRFGTAQDQANAILFLASPMADWITATPLHVNGGALAAGGRYRDATGIWTNMPLDTRHGGRRL